VAVRTDGTLWAWGRNKWGQLGDGSTTRRLAPEQIASATYWASVAAGDFHTLGVHKNGTLWVWGWNAFGQLGDGTTADHHKPKRIDTPTN
jgi:alpha-tubulin suppressor-like RCC1 family protein